MIKIDFIVMKKVGMALSNFFSLPLGALDSSQSMVPKTHKSMIYDRKITKNQVVACDIWFQPHTN